MPNEKWSPQLKQSADAAEEDLQVVVELKDLTPQAPSANRAERMRSLQQSFERQAKPIKDKILGLGGKVTHEAWINSTIAARLPKQALEELAREDGVQRLDVPRAIERE